MQEVIVGVPFAIYPDMAAARWIEEGLKILPPEEAQKARQMFGKNTIATGKYAAMEQENEALIAILNAHGIKVSTLAIFAVGRRPRA